MKIRLALEMNLPDAHATLLAALMEADVLVKHEEIEAGRRILVRASKAKDSEGLGDWGRAVGDHSDLAGAVAAFKDRPLKAREMLIADLWEMAFSDGEVHRDERDFIHKVAEWLDVPPLSKESWPIPVSE